MRVHLGIGGGYTACRIFIPDLLEEERYWYPPHDDLLEGTGFDMSAIREALGGNGPVTCPWCLEGSAAPLCSTNPAALRMFVVYEHPRDAPDEFIVREWLVAARLREGKLHLGEIVARGTTLEGVREQLLATPRGAALVRRPRREGDEPQVVEVWL